jgi:hypothetical protein
MTRVVFELFCNSIAEHPVVENDKILSAEAEKVGDAIYRFYSLAAGRLMVSRKKNAKR